jgi:hypothetical protein
MTQDRAPVTLRSAHGIRINTNNRKATKSLASPYVTLMSAHGLRITTNNRTATKSLASPPVTLSSSHGLRITANNRKATKSLVLHGRDASSLVYRPKPHTNVNAPQHDTRPRTCHSEERSRITDYHYQSNSDEESHLPTCHSEERS